MACWPQRPGLGVPHDEGSAAASGFDSSSGLRTSSSLPIHPGGAAPPFDAPPAARIDGAAGWIRKLRKRRWRSSMPAGRGTAGVVTGSRVDHFPRLYPSQLEPRLVLHGAPMMQLDASGLLSVDAGDAAGDGAADVFSIQWSSESEFDAGQTAGAGSAGWITVSIGESESRTFDAGTVRQVQVTGSSDRDQLNLDAEVLDRQIGVSFDGVGGRDSIELGSRSSTRWAAVDAELPSGGSLVVPSDDPMLASGTESRQDAAGNRASDAVGRRRVGGAPLRGRGRRFRFVRGS